MVTAGFFQVKIMKWHTLLMILGVLQLQPLHSLVLGADTNQAQFTLLTQFKCDNNPVCAVSQPNQSISVVSKSQCVLYCQNQRKKPESCIGVNYQEQNNICDVYFYEATKFAKNVNGCQYIQKGSIDNLKCKVIFDMKDCADVMNYTGSSTDGLYTVNIGSSNSNSPLTVYCDMTTASGGWTVFQRRKDGSVDFYRSWTDYAAGFGNTSGEFWIGNDNLNKLSSAKRYKLRIDLSDFSGNTRYAEYNNFVVSSSSDNYRLSSLGTYTGTAGDSMVFHSGQQFSTYDQDHEPSPDNCAVTYRGAWWYNKCHESNLNGYYYGGPHSTFADGVEWKAWTGFYYSLKTTEMKIKPFN